MYRKPCLADAARTDERQQPVTIEQFFDFGHVVLASDEVVR